MQKNLSKKPKILKELSKNIPVKKMGNMVIFGLNITLGQLTSHKTKDRVIIYLNNALLNSRKEFDKLVSDVIEYQKKQDKLKSHIMKNAEEIRKVDPDIFKLLDESDS